MQKKIIVCPQIYNFDAVFTRHKPRDTDFTVQSRNEAYKNSAKLSNNWRSDLGLGGGGAVAQ